MSGILVWVLEQWVGCDGLIAELREGRMSGPPRLRGRRGFCWVWVYGPGAAAFGSPLPPPFLRRHTTAWDNYVIPLGLFS